MNQKMIDDLSDLLQGRNSDHRKYPYGHPKYRPEPNEPLPYVPGLGSRITLEFDTPAQAKRFFEVFRDLSDNARKRCIEHFKEICTIENGV